MKLSFFSQEERHAVAKRRKKSHLEQNELAKMVYMYSSVLQLAPGSRDLSQAEIKKNNCYQT